MVPSKTGTRENGLFAQQLDELLDRGVGRNGDNFRPRLHGLAHGFFAEFHHRLDQVAVAFVQNAFFLTGFDQRIDGFRLGLRLLVGVFLGQSRHRLQEAQHQGHRQHQIDEACSSSTQRVSHCALGAREKNEGQEAVKHDHDQDQAQRGLQNFVNAPGPVAEHGEAHQHGDGGRRQLGQHRHGQRGARPAHSQPRLDVLLEGVDVVLKFAGKKLADFGVEAIHVGDQGQQPKQQRAARLRWRSSSGRQ